MALSANDVLTLARAGYNSQQIALLSKAAEQQAQPAQPTQPTQPAQPAQPAQPTQPTQPAQPTQPTQPAQPAQPTQPTQPAQPAEQPSAGDLMAELQKLTGAIQMQNQLNSLQPKAETVEDILANIIEP